MGIIEDAARRLDELRRAGIEPSQARRTPDPDQGRNADQQAPAPARAVLELEISRRQVVLDRAALAERGIVVPGAPRNRLADEFRAIKRPLLANIRGKSAAPIKRANCIMVTSSVPQEGKTFTAINVAMSLAAEVDSRVLLIDADVMRPSVLDRLGLPPERGLLELLTEPSLKSSELVLRTNIEGLYLLPAGTPRADATELLASAAMGRLVAELASSEYNWVVIFDSPPLLATPETPVLASHAGQIVVVVEALRTPRSTVQQALELIKDCPVAMLLLNKTRGRWAASNRYGYGYGYGYGYEASRAGGRAADAARPER